LLIDASNRAKRLKFLLVAPVEPTKQEIEIQDHTEQKHKKPEVTVTENVIPKEIIKVTEQLHSVATHINKDKGKHTLIVETQEKI